MSERDDAQRHGEIARRIQDEFFVGETNDTVMSVVLILLCAIVSKVPPERRREALAEITAEVLDTLNDIEDTGNTLQ
jgi:hypothetical protein